VAAENQRAEAARKGQAAETQKLQQIQAEIKAAEERLKQARRRRGKEEEELRFLQTPSQQITCE
jgi:membrane protein insertase Oxa1/YidC/SpoIIIJ